MDLFVQLKPKLSPKTGLDHPHKKLYLVPNFFSTQKFFRIQPTFFQTQVLETKKHKRQGIESPQAEHFRLKN